MPRLAASGQTYYQDTMVKYTPCAPLVGAHDVDTLIVGGGFAGLNTALAMAERGGRDIMLLEAHDIGHGASGRNGGFVFAGYSLGEQDLVARLGDDAACRLYMRTVDAVETIRTRAHGMDCDLVEEGVIWANYFRDERILRKRQRLLASRFGTRLQWLEPDVLRQQLHTQRYGAGLFEGTAMHLHPLNYARGLASAAQARGVFMHEQTRVDTLQRDGQAGWIVHTAQGARVGARRVVLACGGYLAGLERSVDRAVLPIATYVVVTEPLGSRLDEIMSTRAAVYDSRFAFDYYHPLPDTRLLWGGRISVCRRPAHAIARLLHRDMRRVYPQLADVHIDYAWSGLMSYARHEMPQIGGDGHGLWWAQAFGGLGLAPTTVAGDLLAAALVEGDRGWEAFAPFGLLDTVRPFGFVAAQARYSWLQFRDYVKQVMER